MVIGALAAKQDELMPVGADAPEGSNGAGGTD